MLRCFGKRENSSKIKKPRPQSFHKLSAFEERQQQQLQLDNEVCRLFRNHRFESGFLKHVAFIGPQKAGSTTLISALAPDPHYTTYSEIYGANVSVVIEDFYRGWFFLWDLPSIRNDETADAVVQRRGLDKYDTVVFVMGDQPQKICAEIGRSFLHKRSVQCVFVCSKSDVNLRNLCESNQISFGQAKNQLKDEAIKNFKEQFKVLGYTDLPTNFHGPFVVTPNFWTLHKLHKEHEIDEIEFKNAIFSV